MASNAPQGSTAGHSLLFGAACIDGLRVSAGGRHTIQFGLGSLIKNEIRLGSLLWPFAENASR
jgi:hypothetical protein